MENIDLFNDFIVNMSSVEFLSKDKIIRIIQRKMAYLLNPEISMDVKKDYICLLIVFLKIYYNYCVENDKPDEWLVNLYDEIIVISSNLCINDINFGTLSEIIPDSHFKIKYIDSFKKLVEQKTISTYRFTEGESEGIISSYIKWKNGYEQIYGNLNEKLFI
nr:hypothetical protein [uncultured Desulfobulbus sp.]